MEGFIHTLSDSSKLKVKTYRHLDQQLQNNVDISDISKEQIIKLLGIFNTDLIQDLQNAPYILNIIKIMLTKIEDNTISMMQTAKNIFDLLAMIAHLHQTQSIQNKCVDILLSLSESSLIDIVDNHPKYICSLMTQYMGNSSIDPQLKKSILELLVKWLHLTPPSEKFSFVKMGLNAWISYLVPMLFSTDKSLQKLSLVILEEISEQLKQIDYTDNPKWISICKNLSEKQYTKTLMSLCQKGDDLWLRICCLLLRLLNKQLIKNVVIINSILPMIEVGFKNESLRENAFICWKTFIEVYMDELKEPITPKIVKLFSIPLVSNNAKTEKIALIKFDIWWFAIVKLDRNVLLFEELTLYPFLYYCFGGLKTDDIIPGLTFPNLKKLTVKCLVELVGHEDNCSGCIGDSVLKLRQPILDTKLLESADEKWIRVYKTAFMIISNNMSEASELSECVQNVKCLSTSFITKAAKISDPALCSKVFINFVEQLLMETEYNENLISVIISHILPLLVDNKMGYSEDFLCGDKNKNSLGLLPIQSLVLIVILDTQINSSILTSVEYKSTLTKLVNIGFKIKLIEFCGWLMLQLKNNKSSWILWCRLTESLTNDTNPVNSIILNAVLSWPFQWPNFSLEDDDCLIDVISVWKKFYGCINVSPKKLIDTGLEQKICANISQFSERSCLSKSIFCIQILSTMIKRCLNNNINQLMNTVKPLLESLEETLSGISQYPASDVLLTTTCEVIVVLENIFSSYSNRTAKPSFLQLLINLSETLVKCIHNILEKFTTNCPVDTTSKLIDNLSLLECKSHMNKTVITTIINIMNLIIDKNCLNENIVTKIMKIDRKRNFLKNSSRKKLNNLLKGNKDLNFKSPIGESKNSYSKEIYVHQASWKFDPKKLTNHQREVISRRRDNIPALYEDLSQSQDISDLKSWKPSGYVDNNSSSRGETDNSLQESNGSKSTTNASNKDLSSKDNINANKNHPSENSSDKKELPLRQIENDDMKLNLVESPQTVKNKNGSFRSRLEKNLQRLKEGSVRLSPPLTPPNDHKTKFPESERPMRNRKKPNKFDPDDVRFFGKRRASTSVIEMSSNGILNNQFQETADTNLDTNKDDDITPTKIKNKRNRLIKNLEIDTVEGHPSKEIFNVIISKARREKRKCVEQKNIPSKRKKSLISTDSDVQILNGSLDFHTIPVSIPDSLDSHTIPVSIPDSLDSQTIPVSNLDSSESHTIPVLNNSSAKESSEVCQESILIPETDSDIIESSQDSNTSNKSRRISNIFNSFKMSPLQISSLQQTNSSRTSDTDASIPQENLIETLNNDQVEPSNHDNTSSLNNADFDTEPMIENTALPQLEEKVVDIIDLSDDIDTCPSPHDINTKPTPHDDIDINASPHDDINTNASPHDDIDTNASPHDDIDTNASPHDDIDTNPSPHDDVDLNHSPHDNVDTNSSPHDDIDLNRSSHILSSPHKDDDLKKTELLNNTVDISPIKSFVEDTTMMEEDELMNPVESSKESPSKTNSPLNFETVNIPKEVVKDSSDVEKFSTTNSDPLIRSPERESQVIDSPNILCSEKISPEKRIACNSPPSPNSPQVQKNLPWSQLKGRAAQMLVLCKKDANGDLDVENARTLSPIRAVVRKNLHNIYGHLSERNEEDMLEFNKLLPSPFASPAAPILKRSHDESISSPSSKKKRVSFHDPPVSTMINIEKYLDAPTRSPQPKPKIYRDNTKDNVCLVKKMVSNNNTLSTSTLDAQSDTETIDLLSLDVESQQELEIKRNQLLDDKNSIYPALINCKSNIIDIAAELTSKHCEKMFLIDTKHILTTVGCLAKLTELDVNRLPVKSPKIDTVKKVLTEYEKIYVNSDKCLINNDIISDTCEIDTLGTEIENEENMDTEEIISENIFDSCQLASPAVNEGSTVIQCVVINNEDSVVFVDNTEKVTDGLREDDKDVSNEIIDYVIEDVPDNVTEDVVDINDDALENDDDALENVKQDVIDDALENDDDASENVKQDIIDDALENDDGVLENVKEGAMEDVIDNALEDATNIVTEDITVADDIEVKHVHSFASMFKDECLKHVGNLEISNADVINMQNILLQHPAALKLIIQHPNIIAIFRQKVLNLFE